MSRKRQERQGRQGAGVPGIRRTAGNVRALFHSTGIRNGVWSIGTAAVVVAIVILFNLVVGQIPEAYRNIDVSTTRIYEISDTTLELLEGLEEDVEMTVLAVKEETDERIVTFLSKYEALSDQIHMEWVDPVLHPSALTEYEAAENTIVVSCGATDRTTTISFDDILVMDEYSYYYYGTVSYTEFDGEGQLTSAVNYVTNDTEKKIYQTSGHGESSLSTTVTDLMDQNSYSLTELNLLMTTAIPEDCDLILMYAPVTDLSEEEAQMLRDYLGQGGKVMILLGDVGAGELPVLSSVLEEYGMSPVEGYIADPTRCYQGNYYYIFPELSLTGDMASGISSEMVLLTNTHGMTLTDPARENIVTSQFLSTSSEAYAVTEDSQEQGTFVLGAVAAETVNSAEEEDTGEDADTAEDTGEDADTAEDTGEDADTAEGTAEDTDAADESDTGEEAESRLTVITAASLIDPGITDSFTQLENTTVFMNAVTANFDGVQSLSIDAKSLQVEYNTMQHTGILSFIAIFGIPAAVLIAGFVVWFRRRKA